MAQILIIEDEVLLAKSLRRALAIHGHECSMATTAEEGLAMLQRVPADLVLLDIQLPGMSGLEAIKLIREIDPNISVIVATAYGTMAAAVDALRSGACDFLRKPLDTEEVLLAIDRAVAGTRLRNTVSYYQNVEAGKSGEDMIMANSKAMDPIMSILNRLKSMKLPQASDYPSVLIQGETGTGKDLIARRIHFHGPLGDQPFIEVNCTTLATGLEEAELFGYEKGAFTGADKPKRGLLEVALGGTIFLNEIGDLSREVQAKLLQVIEAKCARRVGGLRDMPVDVRIIAATNRDLKDSARFRPDLYYRLHNVSIQMPPLRDRHEDILSLARHFLSRFGNKYGVPKTLSDEAANAILAYDWPGNVRELRQVLERTSFLSDSRIITPRHLGLPSVDEKPAVRTSPNDIIGEFPPEGLDIEEVEKILLKKAIEACGGNVSDAARKLNLGREALRYRLKKFNLE
jgi:two-component system response regulator AtoC